MTEKNQDRLNAWGPAVLTLCIAGAANLAFISSMWGEARSEMKSNRESASLEIRALRDQVAGLADQIRTIDQRQWETRPRVSSTTSPKP